MDRDRRLTGYLRGQIDQPTAPAGFEVSNGWRVSYRKSLAQSRVLEHSTDEIPTGREAHHVKNHSQIHQRQTMAHYVQAFPLVAFETTQYSFPACLDVHVHCFSP